MPKVFKYLGIVMFFYSNEHEPIHIHAEKGGLESKAEFYIVEGKVTEIKISNVKGRKPLKGNELKDFKIFISRYADQIIQKWIEYFIYHKKVDFEIINERL